MAYKQFREKVRKFLESKRIAIVGISSTNDFESANINYRKLDKMGYELFPVSLKLDEYHGKKCFKSLSSIYESVDAALICTPADITLEIVKQSVTKGIKNIWVHRSFGRGSHSIDANEYLKEKDVNYIDGSCPMMFTKPVDFPHKCIKTILRLGGKLNG